MMHSMIIKTLLLLIPLFVLTSSSYVLHWLLKNQFEYSTQSSTNFISALLPKLQYICLPDNHAPSLSKEVTTRWYGQCLAMDPLVTTKFTLFIYQKNDAKFHGFEVGQSIFYVYTKAGNFKEQSAQELKGRGLSTSLLAGASYWSFKNKSVNIKLLGLRLGLSIYAHRELFAQLLPWGTGAASANGSNNHAKMDAENTSRNAQSRKLVQLGVKKSS
jgi:hypothetical protein